MPPNTQPANTSINYPVGSYWTNLMREQAGQNYLTQLNNQGALERTRVSGEYQLRAQQIESESQRYLAGEEARIKQMLQSRELDHDTAQKALDRAAREAEFARTLAFNQLELEERTKLDTRRVSNEERQTGLQEREIGARLAAEPANFVMNEMWKRGAGMPQVLASVGQNNGVASAGGGNPNSAAQGAVATGIQPAYDDATLQTVAAGIFGGNSQPAFYNPNLGGTGVFGAKIPAPNQMTRGDAWGMSEAEMAIANSFLRGGVEMFPGAGRVSIDPKEWWQQAAESWVPTLDRGAARTSYVV